MIWSHFFIISLIFVYNVLHWRVLNFLIWRNRREYTEKVRSDNERKCWPFAGDLIQSFLPPITVSKFRWWSHELASLLTKSPVSVDDSDPSFRRKAKAKTRQCKKRSIVEICATAPKIQLAEDYVVHKKKIKTTKSKDSGDREFTNKVLIQITFKSMKLIIDDVKSLETFV